MTDRIQEIISFLKISNNFLITTHQNADGDAIAAMLAMAYLLRQLNKEYEIVIHDSHIDQKYLFLWGTDQITTFRENTRQYYEAAVVLDVPSLARIGDPAVLLPDRPYCVKVDHHPSEDDFAEYHLIDTDASSASQLVYNIIEFSGIKISSELAEIVFSGIMYDTGRFSFSNTRERDFEICADLTATGIKPHRIANQLFFNNGYQSMKTIGYGLANLQLFLNGKVSVIFLPQEIMQSNNHSEIEELSNYSVSVRDVEVGLFIREIQADFFKISLRSKGKVNVNSIAKMFGGGGHLHAAGARFKGKYGDLRDRILKEIAKHL